MNTRLPSARLRELDQSIRETLRPVQAIDFAPPAQRGELGLGPMPDYVQHSDVASEIGRLSAEAVVREYELAAKDIEAMGDELKALAKRCEDMTASAMRQISEIKDVANRYREEGKRIFDQIEACSALTDEIRKTCEEIRSKVRLAPQ
jgi:methyl-accepting chemotaxis protein